MAAYRGAGYPNPNPNPSPKPKPKPKPKPNPNPIPNPSPDPNPSPKPSAGAFYVGIYGIVDSHFEILMTCVRQRVEVRHEEVPFTLQGNGYAEVR